MWISRRGLVFAVALMLLPVHAAVGADVELAVETAEVGRDTVTAQSWVEVTLTPEARKAFGKLTLEHIGKVLEVWVDGELVSSPVVQSPIIEGSLVISGAMSAADARSLATGLSDQDAFITLRPIAR